MDHQEVLKEKCAELPKCAKLQEVLDVCNERVSSKSSTTEDCTQELFDFLHCVEHCVSTPPSHPHTHTNTSQTHTHTHTHTKSF